MTYVTQIVLDNCFSDITIITIKERKNGKKEMPTANPYDLDPEVRAVLKIETFKVGKTICQPFSLVLPSRFSNI